ncbi:alternative oxidase [Colletotrichum truncatum]|uniref:Alternative oxidase n=1 Tax=Colletotrichum truncatum TaxID=5467 RepID=A0ACC3ZDS2_COLTU|nr:alternative oxidase [Colletotrichum truncatum]KAF6798018.1 alternative oxidase [Colletotrichum truncatum]
MAVSKLARFAPYGLALMAIWLIVLTARHGSVTSFENWEAAGGDIQRVATGKFITGPAGHYKPKVWNPAEFKDAWLDTQLGGEFDGSRIAHFCNKTKWRDDIVLHMRHSRGGLGNVRGTILDFLYAAMLFGTPIIMPAYVKRTDANLDWMNEDNGYHEYGNLFDKDWLLENLEKYCPQLTIYPTADDAPITATLKNEYGLMNARSDKDADRNELAFIKNLNGWLETQDDYVKGLPTLIPTIACFLNFDMESKPELRKALGGLVRISPALRELAAEAVWAMYERYGLEAALDPREELHRSAYCGVHLRTEDDAVRSGWTGGMYGGFDEQTDSHIEICGALGLRVIYVATGERRDISRFAEKAMDRAGITVVSKINLLNSPEMETVMQNLTWDQQGVLDYEVLSRSSFFTGPVMSSFSWNLAIRRHFNTEGDGSTHWNNPYSIQEDEPRTTFYDGISKLILRPARPDFLESFSPRGMFP